MGDMHAAPLACVLLALCLYPVVARTEALALDELVSRLQARGEVVVYSSDLIAGDAVIEVAEASLEALNHALSKRHLELRRVANHWVITASAAGRGARSQLRVRSTGGQALEGLELRWRGERYPLQGIESEVFDVPVPPGSVVSVHADRHRPVLIRLTDDPTEVALSPTPLLENVIVTGTRHHLSGLTVTGSLHSLGADELSSVPTLGNDALRAATVLPGMSSVGVSAKPRIRGGLDDELLVRLDGVELLDSYHLADFQNAFSAIDDRSVEAVDVYTGGFPARYGNRMSGVMDITPARAAAGPRTELGLSMFSLLANTRQSFNEGASDYLASIRRGNLDLITKEVDPDLGRPRYYDAFARLEHRPSPEQRITAGMFFSKDDVTLHEDETSAGSNIDSRYLWTRLEADGGQGLVSSSMLTYTWSRRSKKLEDLDDDSGAGGSLDHDVALWKLAGRTDFALTRGQSRMEFGADVEYGSGRYDTSATIDRGILGTILTGNALQEWHITTDPNGWTGGMYWAGEFPITSRLSVQPGVRWDFQSFDRGHTRHHLSPRLGLRYRPGDLATFRIDVGRYYQPEALHELQTTDGRNEFERPQRADHLIAGGDWMPSAQWGLRGELYLKRYRHPKTRFENLFNPFVLVPELEPDRVPIRPERARARGADLEIERYFSDVASATLRYSYMDAEDRIDGDWMPRRWSQRHTVHAGFTWRSPTLTASAVVTWHSGWRGASLPESLPLGRTLTVADVLNRVELEDFFSLDVSLRRTWQRGRSRITGFVTVTNLTNRSNVAGIEYDAALEDDLVIFERERETLVPLVPSLGVLVAF